VIVRAAAFAVVVAATFAPAAPAVGRTITVGPEGAFATIREAASAARDGDVVEIAAGTYAGDVATWRANDLTIRGVGGVILDADGAAAEGKAIWVIKGDRVVVEGIVFRHARVEDLNGAGIRHEGGTLTVRDSIFEDNEMGILTRNGAPQVLIVEASRFIDNGRADANGGRQGHAIYAGTIAELVVVGSSFQGTRIGHHVKSRAARTTVTCSAFIDGKRGTASYAIDIANGGDATIAGNVFHKGRYADNPHTIAYGAEGLRNEGRDLVIAFNTFVDAQQAAAFVRTAEGAKPRIVGNLFIGAAPVLDDDPLPPGNMRGHASGLVAIPEGDYRPAAGSAAIDTAPSDADGPPACEFDAPAGTRPRTLVGPPDLGAYEAAGP
jgi:hypothetical protein